MQAYIEALCCTVDRRYLVFAFVEHKTLDDDPVIEFQFREPLFLHPSPLLV